MFRRRRRRIVWDDFAKVPLLEAAQHHERLYDVVRMFEWLLERQPDNNFAEPLDDTFWWIKSEDLPLHGPGVPSIVLIYYFDDDTVTFWGARVGSGSPDDT